jgi:hypothetical protein
MLSRNSADAMTGSSLRYDTVTELQHMVEREQVEDASFAFALALAFFH